MAVQELLQAYGLHVAIQLRGGSPNIRLMCQINGSHMDAHFEMRHDSCYLPLGFTIYIIDLFGLAVMIVDPLTSEHH